MFKISKNISAFYFFISFIITSCAQSEIKIPAEFKETTQPKVWSEKWYLLNNSKNEYKVAITGSNLNIEKTREINKCELKIETGTLLGIDNGEFGGELIFAPQDKTKNSIKITRGNIKFIFRFKDKIYFITGLAHMGYSGGALFELSTEENNFSFKIIIEFDNAPQAFTIYNDKLFVAAEKNFYVIKNFKKEVLFKNVFWEGLYPNSIAVFNDENVFIGLRSGIVKLNLNKKILKFYKND